GDLRAADALANWQRWTAQGSATVSIGVLCLTGPDLTVEQWAERVVTKHLKEGTRVKGSVSWSEYEDSRMWVASCVFC
ncbi:hypothetical protein MKK84_02355, partial [Methylobacterium sp. E-065]|nr:hypothetical protein [Methylobacterium sp. E-065]